MHHVARRTLPSSSAALAAVLSALLVTLAACAGGPPVTQTPPPDNSRATPASQPPASDVPWPLKTREHLDLWLHGYAMLVDDTAKVPLFRPGYHDMMAQRRRQRNVATALDANRETLRARLRTNPGLVNGQFVPLYFASWDEMRRAADLFLQVNGDPRRASDQATAQVIGFFAASFPAAADREWLRLFLVALDDERTAFYRAYWQGEQDARLGVFTTVDTLWQRRALPRLHGFLNNTQQPGGDLMLALPLGGEGRTVGGRRTENVVAVTYPDTPAAAAEAIYVFAHEVVGTLAAQAVTDNITPAEAREGGADRLQSPAAVQGGYILLQRAAPELAPGYAAYYLRVAGARGFAGADPAAALQGAFPLPAAVREALARQIESVLAGI
jgi:hypothetical protein